MPVRIADGAKRGQGEGGQFQMLFGKRKSDDGDRHQDCENNMNNGNIKTAQQDPENVKKQVQTTIPCSFKIKCLTEGCH